MQKKCPTEQQEQFALVYWLRANKIRFFHVPNGGYGLNPRTGAKLKRLGLQRGVPDLVLPVPIKPYHGLYIELKRQKGSVTSPEQTEWIEFLNRNGYLAVICKGAEEAIKVIKDYLDL